MAEIIIKGDFTIEGDLPGLDLTPKRFRSMHISNGMPMPQLRMETFEAIPETLEKENGGR